MSSLGIFLDAVLCTMSTIHVTHTVWPLYRSHASVWGR